MFMTHIQRLDKTLDDQITENTLLKQRIADLKNAATFSSEKIDKTINEQKEIKADYEKKIKGMVVKHDDLEDQNHRNNLKIYGIVEGIDKTWDKTEKKVRDFLRNELELNADEIEIERAHRVGKTRKDDRSRNDKRLIVAKFLCFKNKKDILDAYHGKKYLYK